MVKGGENKITSAVTEASPKSFGERQYMVDELGNLRSDSSGNTGLAAMSSIVRDFARRSRSGERA